MTHNTTYSDDHARACSEIVRTYSTNTNHERTTSAALLSAMLEQDSVPALRSQESGAVPCAAKLHRNAERGMTRGAMHANIVGIDAADSTLEGAASKAHLSPMHGT